MRFHAYWMTGFDRVRDLDLCTGRGTAGACRDELVDLGSPLLVRHDFTASAWLNAQSGRASMARERLVLGRGIQRELIRRKLSGGS